MYFGEYPLAFAACTNQEDCYRILRAKKADPNAQDTNGNTVLHMTVIHENLVSFFGKNGWILMNLFLVYVPSGFWHRRKAPSNEQAKFDSVDVGSETGKTDGKF